MGNLFINLGPINRNEINWISLYIVFRLIIIRLEYLFRFIVLHEPTPGAFVDRV